MPTKKAPRRYSNTRRAAQAAQTRAEVLAAATELFGARGWAGTTLANVAEQAGVAIETVYSGFGSKRGLLISAMDTAVVGDTADVALIDRPEVQALAHGPLAERLQRGMTIMADVNERTAGLWRAANEAAASDHEVASWHEGGDKRRRLDIERVLALIFGRPIDDATVDVMWALYAADAYVRLTQSAGWTRAQYVQHMVDVTKRLVSRR
jgi:AcrR family transcriptional regulator